MGWMRVLWPSFLMAGIAELFFFAVIDPQTLYFLGEEVIYSPLTRYAIGFFLFWVLCAASSAMTLLLVKRREEVNAPATTDR